MRVFIVRIVSIGLLYLAMGITLASCLSAAVSSQVPNPPGNLRVEITIQQGTQASGSAALSVKFFDASGHFIEFAAGETIACNGTFLAFHDDAFLGLHVDAYTGKVSLPPMGSNYICVYQIPNGTRATITVPSQHSLVVTSPTDGTRVAIPRTTHTLAIAYIPVSGRMLSGSAQDSAGHEVQGKSEEETGTYTLDDAALASFEPGAGALSLTRTWAFTPPGTGFQAVSVAYSLTSTLQVTWV